MLPDQEWLSNHPHKAFNLHIYNTKKIKTESQKKMKPSNSIFFSFHCPFSHATQSHILKFPQFQSYTPLHCSPLISEVSVTANLPIRLRQSRCLEKVGQRNKTALRCHRRHCSGCLYPPLSICATFHWQVAKIHCV